MIRLAMLVHTIVVFDIGYVPIAPCNPEFYSSIWSLEQHTSRTTSPSTFGWISLSVTPKSNNSSLFL